MYSIIKYALRTAILVIGIFITTTSVMAFPVTVSFSGHVTGVQITQDDINVDDTFTGQFQYDSNEPPDWGDSTSATYWHLYNYFFVNFNGLNYTMNIGGGVMEVYNNWTGRGPAMDGLAGSAFVDGPAIGGFGVYRFIFDLLGPSIFSSTNLPLGPVDLSSFTYFNVGELDFSGDGGLLGVFLTFDTFNITSVPEPGILILLGLSMVSIAGLRRWWK